jgi:hypothetical protein
MFRRPVRPVLLALSIPSLLLACGEPERASLAPDEPAYGAPPAESGAGPGVTLDLPPEGAPMAATGDAGTSPVDLAFIDVGEAAEEAPAPAEAEPADAPAEAEPADAPAEAAPDDAPAPPLPPPGEPDDDAPAPPLPPPGEPGAGLPVVDLNGPWHGYYTCLQGDTAVALTLVHDPSSGALAAEFAFGPSRENPDVPEGRFALSGAFDPLFMAATLTPDRWIDRPEGYGMVGVEAFYDPFADRLDGWLDDPACSDFAVERAR